MLKERRVQAVTPGYPTILRIQEATYFLITYDDQVANSLEILQKSESEVKEAREAIQSRHESSCVEIHGNIEDAISRCQRSMSSVVRLLTPAAAGDGSIDFNNPWRLSYDDNSSALLDNLATQRDHLRTAFRSLKCCKDLLASVSETSPKGYNSRSSISSVGSDNSANIDASQLIAWRRRQRRVRSYDNREPKTNSGQPLRDNESESSRDNITTDSEQSTPVMPISVSPSLPQASTFLTQKSSIDVSSPKLSVIHELEGLSLTISPDDLGDGKHESDAEILPIGVSTVNSGRRRYSNELSSKVHNENGYEAETDQMSSSLTDDAEQSQVSFGYWRARNRDRRNPVVPITGFNVAALHHDQALEGDVIASVDVNQASSDTLTSSPSAHLPQSTTPYCHPPHVGGPVSSFLPSMPVDQDPRPQLPYPCSNTDLDLRQEPQQMPFVPAGGYNDTFARIAQTYPGLPSMSRNIPSSPHHQRIDSPEPSFTPVAFQPIMKRVPTVPRKPFGLRAPSSQPSQDIRMSVVDSVEAVNSETAPIANPVQVACGNDSTAGRFRMETSTGSLGETITRMVPIVEPEPDPLTRRAPTPDNIKTRDTVASEPTKRVPHRQQKGASYAERMQGFAQQTHERKPLLRTSQSDSQNSQLHRPSDQVRSLAPQFDHESPVLFYPISSLASGAQQPPPNDHVSSSWDHESGSIPLPLNHPLRSNFAPAMRPDISGDNLPSARAYERPISIPMPDENLVQRLASRTGRSLQTSPSIPPNRPIHTSPQHSHYIPRNRVTPPLNPAHQESCLSPSSSAPEAHTTFNRESEKIIATSPNSQSEPSNSIPRPSSKPLPRSPSVSTESSSDVSNSHVRLQSLSPLPNLSAQITSLSPRVRSGPHESTLISSTELFREQTSPRARKRQSWLKHQASKIGMQGNGDGFRKESYGFSTSSLGVMAE